MKRSYLIAARANEQERALAFGLVQKLGLSGESELVRMLIRNMAKKKRIAASPELIQEAIRGSKRASISEALN